MKYGDAIALACHHAARGRAALPVGISWDEQKQACAKRSLTRHGFHDATTDRGQLEHLICQGAALLRPGEELGVGIVPRADEIALDVDDKGSKTGSDDLADLEAEHGRLPPHPIAVTQTGWPPPRWFRKPADVRVGNVT